LRRRRGARRRSEDRLTSRRFLTAHWRDLLILSYEADPTLLARHVPPGTELDSHDGRLYVSVVGFRFLHTRVLGVPIPGHRNFDELNLRFYVRRETAGEVRRGVVFIREVVPRRAVAALARAVYNEPYVTLPMRSRVTGSPSSVEFAWFAGRRWHRVAARAGGPGAIPAAGSHEEFITEHHWGYTRQRDGGTIEYRVEHPAWKVWSAAGLEIEADFRLLYDPALAAILERPVSALVADGSAVTVCQPRRLPRAMAAA
jgi:uncharacterized protein YqjF (DUF2071 family)